MKVTNVSPGNERLRLKEPSGWFAAGNGFRTALALLSDGAFHLFAYLCLEANRQTGRIEATHKELAAAVNKSKRSIGNHIDELQINQFCNVFPAKNQYARTVFEISDRYWPYHRNNPSQPSEEERNYLDAVRRCFLSLGCTSPRFGVADEQAARHMYHRCIPLGVIDAAMLLGVCRKYICWLNNGQSLKPIQGLCYFEPVIAEVQAQPLPPGYAAYLRHKFQQLTAAARAKGLMADADAVIHSKPSRNTDLQRQNTSEFTVQ